MKRIALIASAALAALALVVASLFALAPSKAEAGPVTASYMDPRSSLRYDVDAYVFSPTTTTATLSAVLVGAVPPGKHTLKCVSLHQATAGAGTTNRWKVTPKKNGTSLVLTAGEIGTAAGANHYVDNANCPMPDPSISATVADSFVRPILTTTTSAITANGGDIVTLDVEFVNTWTAVPSGVVRLYWQPEY